MNSPPAVSARDTGGPLGAAWVREYSAGVLRADVVAGLTLAAYLLPSGIGDASLAGLPAQAGLYACMFSGLAFWLLCSSRHTAITVTSAISLLLGTTLGGLAGGDATRYWALASCTALLVAALAFVAWLLRGGSLVNFVSEAVLVGFKAGVALTLASTQLPKLFGIAGAHGNFWACVRHFVVHLRQANLASLATGLAALSVLILGRLFLKNKPVALAVMIGGIAGAALLGLEARGVTMLGEVPSGFPTPTLPAVGWDDLNDLLPLAMACFLLGAVETAAIGRMFGAKHGRRLDANRELLGLAGANLAAGLGQGFPVSGGMSQSLVNESAGARTPVSGFVAALLVLTVAVFFSDLLRNLPQPVLAAVVLMAVIGLFNIRTLTHLWRADRPEFAVAMAALAGVLASGLLRGVLIGAAISLVLLIRRASRPHVAILGRIPGSRRYSDLERHPDNEPVPGILIFRPEGALVYFNAEHVRECALARARAQIAPLHAAVCDLSAAPFVDMTGAEMLLGLEQELRAVGARLVIVEARSAVRDRLRAQGLEDQIGRLDRMTSVADAVELIEKNMKNGAIRPV
jgi:high affinity sulfate transporter 1